MGVILQKSHQLIQKQNSITIDQKQLMITIENNCKDSIATYLNKAYGDTPLATSYKRLEL